MLKIFTICRKQGESFLASAPAHSTVASALIPVPVREIAPSEEEALMPMPKDVENLADDPNLQNPLQRSERMSTSWFGVSADLLQESFECHLCFSQAQLHESLTYQHLLTYEFQTISNLTSASYCVCLSAHSLHLVCLICVIYLHFS